MAMRSKELKTDLAAADRWTQDWQHAAQMRQAFDVILTEAFAGERGPQVSSEGAYLLPQSLHGDAWDACGDMSFDVMDAPRAFEEFSQKRGKEEQGRNNNEGASVQGGATAKAGGGGDSGAPILWQRCRPTAHPS